jgi:uncharacterized membrane protein YdfJ with MMPL/SSD domain
VLPLVSAILNLLSVAAAYGVVTLAFQTQAGSNSLGVAEQPVVSFVPMLMFAILFGLGMDYNVCPATQQRHGVPGTVDQQEGALLRRWVRRRLDCLLTADLRSGLVGSCRHKGS